MTGLENRRPRSNHCRLAPMRWIFLIIALALAACRSEPATLDPYKCQDCNLLLISIDTLRADHLGTYGYPMATSPLIDDWAARSVIFERAYSTAEKTADSHMSIFTGLQPSSHRILNIGGAAEALRLSDSIETLTEVLQEAGFATAGFHGGGNVESYYGFDRGFDTYQGTSEFFTHPAKRVDNALGWLEERRSERFFLFFHTYFVHDPYIPSPEFVDPQTGTADKEELEAIWESLAKGGFETVRDRFWSGVDGDDPGDVARIMALYDATIRETDQFIGDLIREVRAREPNTLVVLLSDHGEAFQEHGRFLHTDLYNEVTHVPLILSHPRIGEERRIGEVVSLLDLAPSLLDLLGRRPLRSAAGRSFANLLLPDDGSTEEARPAYSEKLWLPPEESAIPTVAIRSMVFADGTKIIHRGEGGMEFYDLIRDPLESDPAARSAQVPPDKVRAMTELADRCQDLGAEFYRGLSAEKVPVDDEAERQLKALGYIQ